MVINYMTKMASIMLQFGKNDIFLYLVIRYKNKPTMFLEKGMDRYYIQAQDGKYGLTVPLEFVEKYERPD